jgi:hypothetical protein
MRGRRLYMMADRYRAPSTPASPPTYLPDPEPFLDRLLAGVLELIEKANPNWLDLYETVL